MEFGENKTTVIDHWPAAAEVRPNVLLSQTKKKSIISKVMAWRRRHLTLNTCLNKQHEKRTAALQLTAALRLFVLWLSLCDGPSRAGAPTARQLPCLFDAPPPSPWQLAATPGPR